MIKTAIHQLLMGKDLDAATAETVMEQIIKGSATNAQIGSFLTAMRMKGETIDEITAFAKVMREKCIKLKPDRDVLDIVGTGGDGADTFNISTVSSFVVSSGGVPVAKHGNRSISSKCGSADVLEALGAKIDLTAAQSQKVLNAVNMCFMFAPVYHASMRYAAPVRKELGVRTVFNILGPLSNPAGANMQLLGVYDENLVEPLARVLQNLGVKRGAVVHGRDGLDEVSLCAATTVCEINGDKINSFFLSPEQLGLKKCVKEELAGGNPSENAEIALNILNGTDRGAKRDIVVLNSAVCLYMSHNNKTLRDCVRLAERLIDSGAAKSQLDKFITLTNSVQ
ncbi:MAG: anthranilate phosphoribosyltransferase [Deferribacterales bacterium]|nr:anthranilate phosphoribosyltransferase [Deferribacterales bacterium]